MFKKIVSTILSICILINVTNLEAFVCEKSFSQQNQTYIPEKIGKVIDIFKGISSKKIYIITDAHCNKAIQENISKIIPIIQTKNKIKKIFVGVEGNFGELNTRFLSFIPKGRSKNKFIKNLTAKGYISGWEIYSSYNPEKVKLYGLEDKEIYLENFKYLYESFGYKKMINMLDDKMQNIFNFGKEKTYPSWLKIFEEQEIKYKSGKLGITEWIEILNSNAKIYRLDARIQENINEMDLLQGIERTSYEIKRKMVEGKGASEEIFYSEQYLHSIKSYLNNGLTNLMQYNARLKDIQELNKKLSSNHYISLNMKKLDDIQKNMEKFYELAGKRNEIISGNMLKAMEKEKIGIMIVGGYHAQGIKELLRAKGISYEIIMPNVREKNNSANIYKNRIIEQAKILGLKKIDQVKLTIPVNAQYLALMQADDETLVQELKKIDGEVLFSYLQLVDCKKKLKLIHHLVGSDLLYKKLTKEQFVEILKQKYKYQTVLLRYFKKYFIKYYDDSDYDSDANYDIEDYDDSSNIVSHIKKFIMLVEELNSSQIKELLLQKNYKNDEDDGEEVSVFAYLIWDKRYIDFYIPLIKKAFLYSFSEIIKDKSLETINGEELFAYLQLVDCKKKLKLIYHLVDTGLLYKKLTKEQFVEILKQKYKKYDDYTSLCMEYFEKMSKQDKVYKKFVIPLQELSPNQIKELLLQKKHEKGILGEMKTCIFEEIMEDKKYIHVYEPLIKKAFLNSYLGIMKEEYLNAISSEYGLIINAFKLIQHIKDVEVYSEGEYVLEKQQLQPNGNEYKVIITMQMLKRIKEYQEIKKVELAGLLNDLLNKTGRYDDFCKFYKYKSYKYVYTRLGQVYKTLLEYNKKIKKSHFKFKKMIYRVLHILDLKDEEKQAIEKTISVENEKYKIEGIKTELGPKLEKDSKYALEMFDKVRANMALKKIESINKKYESSGYNKYEAKVTLISGRGYNTILHEIAHSLQYGNVREELKTKWIDCAQKDKRYVSIYAMVNWEENMAETISVFFTDPEKLQEICPHEFDYLCKLLGYSMDMLKKKVIDYFVNIKHKNVLWALENNNLTLIKYFKNKNNISPEVLFDLQCKVGLNNNGKRFLALDVLSKYFACQRKDLSYKEKFYILCKDKDQQTQIKDYLLFLKEVLQARDSDNYKYYIMYGITMFGSNFLKELIRDNVLFKNMPWGFSAYGMKIMDIILKIIDDELMIKEVCEKVKYAMDTLNAQSLCASSKERQLFVLNLLLKMNPIDAAQIVNADANFGEYEFSDDLFANLFLEQKDLDVLEKGMALLLALPNVVKGYFNRASDKHFNILNYFLLFKNNDVIVEKVVDWLDDNISLFQCLQPFLFLGQRSVTVINKLIKLLSEYKRDFVIKMLSSRYCENNLTIAQWLFVNQKNSDGVKEFINFLAALDENDIKEILKQQDNNGNNVVMVFFVNQKNPELVDAFIKLLLKLSNKDLGELLEQKNNSGINAVTMIFGRTDIIQEFIKLLPRISKEHLSLILHKTSDLDAVKCFCVLEFLYYVDGGIAQWLFINLHVHKRFISFLETLDENDIKEILKQQDNNGNNVVMVFLLNQKNPEVIDAFIKLLLKLPNKDLGELLEQKNNSGISALAIMFGRTDIIQEFIKLLPRISKEHLSLILHKKRGLDAVMCFDVLKSCYYQDEPIAQEVLNINKTISEKGKIIDENKGIIHKEITITVNEQTKVMDVLKDKNCFDGNMLRKDIYIIRLMGKLSEKEKNECKKISENIVYEEKNIKNVDYIWYIERYVTGFGLQVILDKVPDNLDDISDIAKCIELKGYPIVDLPIMINHPKIYTYIMNMFFKKYKKIIEQLKILNISKMFEPNTVLNKIVCEISEQLKDKQPELIISRFESIFCAV
jgi:hypothetical protein